MGDGWVEQFLGVETQLKSQGHLFGQNFAVLDKFRGGLMSRRQAQAVKDFRRQYSMTQEDMEQIHSNLP